MYSDSDEKLEDNSLNTLDNNDAQDIISDHIEETNKEKLENNTTTVETISSSNDSINLDDSIIDSSKNNNDNKLICLDSCLTSNEVTGDFIQYLVVNYEYLIEPLPEDVLYQIDTIRIENFFNQLTRGDLLQSFPLLKMLYQKYVPKKIKEYDFWPRFIWCIHYYFYNHHKQDFNIKDIKHDNFSLKNNKNINNNNEIEIGLLSDDNTQDIDNENEVDIIKLDYHSVNRYIASAILAFLKVFIVCAVLKNYDASWYYYLYPALWVLIGFLIILRALQIQKKNNKIKQQLDKSLEEGIELQEMESI